MSSSPSGGLPPNSSIAIDDSHHGPIVTIVTAMMLVGSIFSLLIRAAIRYPFSAKMGLDDGAAIIGSVIAFVQSGLTFAAVNAGLGQRIVDLTGARIDTMEKYIYAADLLFVVVLIFSRLAVALLLQRLASAKELILASRIVAAVIGAWGVAAVLAVAIRPNLAAPWDIQYGVSAQIANAWKAITALGIVMEVALLILPLFLVWNLQMARQVKVAVMTGFAFRIPVIALSILRILSLNPVLTSSTLDVSWELVIPTVLTQVEMHYSLIAATIPCMRLFLKNFSTGYLGTTLDQVDPLHTTVRGTRGSNSYALSSVHSRSGDHKQMKEKARTTDKDMSLRPDGGVTTSRIVHNDTNSLANSVTSDGSDKIMVKKTVRIDYRDVNT